MSASVAAVRSRIARRYPLAVVVVVVRALSLRKGGSFGRPQDRPGVLQALLRPANLVTTARYLHPDATQVQAMVEEM